MLRRSEKPTDGQIYPGLVFGKWTVLKFAGKVPGSTAKVEVWLCRCACGVEKGVTRSNLLKSCSTQCMSCARKATAERLRGQQPWSASKWPRAWSAWYAACRKYPEMREAWGGGAAFAEWFETHDPYPAAGASLFKKDASLPHSPTNSVLLVIQTDLEKAVEYIAQATRKPLAAVKADCASKQRQGIYARAERLRAKEAAGLPTHKRVKRTPKEKIKPAE